MTSGTARTAAFPRSLATLRWRLTAWYVGTFFAILALLGVGLFVTITDRFDRELDESLARATGELARVVEAKDRALPGTTALLDTALDLRIPDRTLLVVDTLGRALGGGAVSTNVGELARAAMHSGSATFVFTDSAQGPLRAHAQRVQLSGGRSVVAVGIAGEIEIEDRYASLIAIFGVASIVALVLVAFGGWLLARQSTEPVERSVAHMRRFMADAAHELRTPISVVRSRADVALQRPRDSEEYTVALTGIARETERLGGIVEDLLMLARADAGERPIERARVFLDDIALDAADAARVIADRKGVRVEVAEFEESPVEGDAALLRQLAIILLDNAVKFTATGGLVTVAVRSQPAGATLSVVDTGIGIHPEHLPHVFERFYRGDPARTRERASTATASEGVGLGLSIARWITDEHGGAITITSAPAEGTMVTVQFPSARTDSVVSSS
jgi:signal transduction histidine kinase